MLQLDCDMMLKDRCLAVCEHGSCCGFIEATFRHSLGPEAVRRIFLQGGREEFGCPSPPHYFKTHMPRWRAAQPTIILHGGGGGGVQGNAESTALFLLLLDSKEDVVCVLFIINL